MTHIIDGKRYNTATATRIGSRSQCHGSFTDFDEDLYRTPKGSFFLVGEGGPMTKYAHSCGQNSWSGGSGVNILSETEALAWCEKADVKPEIIEKYFTVVDA
jgi:hypothetical protein